MASSVPRIPFEKYTLPNGLQVILHIDRKLPVVHVNQWFHVGSKNERPGRTGFAHLFEHLMFEGSKHAPEGYFQYIERAGANLNEGGVNGTTDYDRTNYFATVPSGNLEFVLWLESDRMATLADALTQENFDNQRDVVRNERRQRLENQPYGRWRELLSVYLHPPGHPYAWPVIGSHEDLEAATLDDVRDFFRTYYTPNNLSLAIAGDFDPDEAKRLIERYYGGMTAGPLLSRPVRWVPQLTGEKIIEVRDRVPQERLYMAWPVPPRFDADEMRLDLASGVLADGLSSRLKKRLVYEEQACTEVYALVWSSEISGVGLVMATARPGSSLPAIEKAVTEEVARLAEEGPTPEERSRAQTRWEYQFITGLERIGGFGGKADRLNEANVYRGDPGYFMREFEQCRHVTEDDIRQGVARWLDTGNRLLLRFYPETAQRVASSAGLDRSQAPALGKDKPFHPPEVRSGRLDNGVDLFVVERPELPRVSVTFAVRAGSAYDPAGKEGLSHLALMTMDKGTQTKTALEVAAAFGDLGVTLQAMTRHESSLVTFDVLKRNLTAAMALFAEVIHRPSFPEAEFERERKKHLDVLAQHETTPTALAARIGPMLLFGRDHPYGRPSRGLPASIQRLSRADLASYYDMPWRRAGPALILTGDITMEEATALARRHLGDWPASSPAAPARPAPQRANNEAIYGVDRPGAPQTVVRFMLPAPERTTPDYYALRLADIVWGGSFASRLNRNLREEKGYTYGVSSALTLHAACGMWWAQGSVETGKTGDTVVQLQAELRGLAGEKPVSEEELSQARVNRLRGYAQQFESLRRIGGRIAELWTAGLPMSEFRRAIEAVEQTTLEAVNEAARRYARPDQAITLLIGDAAKIEAQVRDMGDFVVLDAQGQTLGPEKNHTAEG